MKLRDLLVIGAVSGLVLGSGVAFADDTAPLPAGGPAAQSEGAPAVGSIVEIGGILFAVTVAGLVALDSDDDSVPASSTSTTGT